MMLKLKWCVKKRCLGVMTDNKLNWKIHINYLSTKMSRFIEMLYMAQDFLNQNYLYNIFYLHIAPT